MSFPRAALALAILWLMALPAQAHDFYSNWFNGKNQNCCNQRDCGVLADKDERTHEGQLEVRIDGTWCPVLSHHYLTRGNAPDHSTAHICVRPGEGQPCSRLLCYQPRPLS